MNKVSLFFAGYLVLLTYKGYSTPSIGTLMVNRYPSIQNTRLDDCLTCHSPAVKDFLNSYGLALKSEKLAFEKIENKDSDHDGRTNLSEIKALNFPGSRSAVTERFVFTNPRGNVSFNHATHVIGATYLSLGKCANCHDGTPKTFPKYYNDTISVREIAHQTCLWNCHLKAEQTSAPTRCQGCHGGGDI